MFVGEFGAEKELEIPRKTSNGGREKLTWTVITEEPAQLELSVFSGIPVLVGSTAIISGNHVSSRPAVDW